MAVFRCFTEKKSGFDVEARGVLSDLRDNLGLNALTAVRIFNRYDTEGVTEAVYRAAKSAVFSEPPIDDCHDEVLPALGDASWRLSVEALPGQYDQRADSCAQCIQMAAGGERPTVRAAKVYVFYGGLSEADPPRLRAYLVNPVEAREASEEKPETLLEKYAEPERVPTLTGFAGAPESALEKYLDEYRLAMDLGDLAFLQAYFRDTEKRDPTMTELRLIDTYWSDHCRHTTFLTALDVGELASPAVRDAYERYLELRREVYGEEEKTRPVTLMDLATIGAKALKKRGFLTNLDISDEINACSIHIDTEIDGKIEDWLLLFKNETHNHPTEIEPFGGAATCIGGAIRDPLSGRAYVYQAMRVTGSGDPRAPMADTLPGKLPQRKLTVTAARGYSSYGNQIGLATGLVREIYHPGYAAKRMEIGAVVGAVKFENVRRETPAAGDVVLLLGGRTGRDGIGGATGSSKTHNQASLVTMASEVQKGNAPEERKLQRLFRDPEVTKMIKRCNDFGAGGVSVAIGELADGLDIDLSLVRKKYEGLNATELAISESQERMAVVVAPGDAEKFIQKAEDENLEAYIVARVTAEPYMTLRFEGEVVARLSREFLSSNGAPKRASVAVAAPAPEENLRAGARDLRFAAQTGLIELFDSSVGAGTVLAPLGGKTRRTPPQVMAALIPVPAGETSTCSVMAFGFDPFLSESDPYEGAKTAVTQSIAKLVASGCDPDKAYLTFQEYFEKLRREPERWGKPFSALLGALDAQIGLETAAIGGKDSMSGSFLEYDVPPTLVSFAVAPADARKIISPEFKAAGHDVALFCASENPTLRKALQRTKDVWREIHGLIADGTIVSAWAIDAGGTLGGVRNMCLGNDVGFRLAEPCDRDAVYAARPGSILAELTRDVPGTIVIGETLARPEIVLGGETVPLAELLRETEAPLEPIFPTRADAPGRAEAISFDGRPAYAAVQKFAAPRAAVFSFPGTNSELDTARAVERAGGHAELFVVKNLTPALLAQSVAAAVRVIQNSQMLILPGGFAGGDEPDGSAKFITAFFRSPAITDAVHELLYGRYGLMLGICNGFQALIKLGLVPFGRVVPPKADSPTLTYNVIGRHQARYVYTRVSSAASPWMCLSNVGDVHALPVSHGEGRFAAGGETLAALIQAGQVATQYVDEYGAPSMDIAVNPNGSLAAIEGIFSPDGRVLGKMGHTERRGAHVAKNIHGDKHQPIFESGVHYFK